MTPTIIAALERATLTALPAPRLLFDGPFVVKAFLGGTGRANAAASLDPAPDPALAERVARIAAHYRRLGLRPRFRSSPLDPPGLVAHLQALGWHAADESLVTRGPVEPIACADAAVAVLATPEAEWLEVISTVEYQSATRRAEKLEAVPLFAIPAGWLVLREGGRAVAAMSATCDGTHCGVFDLAVRPEARRRGLAQRMIRAAAHWAAAQGATHLFAQVAATNAASIALQASLGMREQYRYTYHLAT